MATIDILPNELLWTILRPAVMETPFFINRVCKRWYEIAAQQLLLCSEGRGTLASSLCARLAQDGNLARLKQVREQGAPWNATVCCAAAAGGQLKVLKWLRSNDCPWDESTPCAAANHDEIDCLRFVLRENCPQAWLDEGAAVCAAAAAAAGSWQCLKAATDAGCQIDSSTISVAAECGHGSFLRRLHARWWKFKHCNPYHASAWNNFSALGNLQQVPQCGESHIPFI